VSRKNRTGSFPHIGNPASYRDALKASQLAEATAKVSHVTIGGVGRDYGLFGRDEATQAFEPTDRS
jgi:hypothetical protein